MVAKKKKPKKAFAGEARIEALKATQESPLQRLRSREHIDVWEHTAADEIIAAHQMVNGMPVARDSDLGMPQGMRHGLADNEAAKRIDIVDTYQVWRKDLAGTPMLAVTMKVLFSEVDPRYFDNLHRWRKGTARGHLIAALRHYAALRGNVPRGVRDWKLTVTERC